MFDQRSHSKRFVLKGIWWVHGKDSVKSDGEFVYEPDGSMYLGLSNSLTTPGSSLMNLDKERRTLLGETHSEQYTLFNCWESGTFEVDGHKWKTSWRPDLMAIGKHLESADKPEFSYATIAFDILPYLLDTGRLSLGPHRDGKASVHWQQAPTFSMKITEGQDEWKLTSASQPVMQVQTLQSAEIKEFTCFRIETRSPHSVHWFAERALSLRTLLILCAGEPIHLTDLKISGSSQEHQVFVKQTATTQKPDKNRLLLPLFPVEEPFIEILTNAFNRYFNLEEEMRIVIGITAAAIQQPNTYHRSDFINLTQALEGFHRLAMPPGKFVSDDEYQATIQDTLLKAIPDVHKDFRTKLEAMIEHGNEYSQRKRFKEIGRLLQPDFGKLIPKPSSFANVVCDARNAFTHAGGGITSPISEQDCLYANKGLILILLLLIHRHLGVPASQYQNVEITRLFRTFSVKRFW